MQFTRIIAQVKYQSLYTCSKCKKHKEGGTVFMDFIDVPSLQDLIHVLNSEHQKSGAMPLGWSFNGIFTCKDCH